MEPLPDTVKELIESTVYANVATLMPDGSPHVVMTWVDHEGDLILINTVKGSQKHRNATRNPKIALTIVDPANSYNVATIRGRVKEVTFDGAEEHIDKLAKKYIGQEKYPMRGPGRERVLIKIEATRVIPPFTDTSRRKWMEGSKEKTWKT
jgi:PPOX class probable F420-dependent enzyme